MSYQTLIDAPTLQQHSQQPDWCVFDCRFNLADTGAGQHAYTAAHLPGARYLHLDHDLSSPVTPRTGRHPLPAPETLAARLRACGLNQGMQVVVYDDNSGIMAARAWWLLRWLGHREVAVLDGGIQAWLAAGYTLDDRAVTSSSGNFQPRPQDDFTVDTAILSGPNDWQLVDARTPERFRGENEPIDPVAGHIPGAWNRANALSLQDGKFKSPDTLRTEWLALLNGTAPKKIVHMCGSGVTACHNQLSMEIAGLGGTRLYPGSWSRWIRDADRPVAKG
ncbi:MAG TPA: sulfurtransferase [Thiolinea sp.]|nr:sulfurtransferase [Thiolinea sp.]